MLFPPLAMWVLSCLGLSPGCAMARGGPGGLQPAQGEGTPELLAEKQLWPWPRLQPCAGSVLSADRGVSVTHIGPENLIVYQRNSHFSKALRPALNKRWGSTTLRLGFQTYCHQEFNSCFSQ